MASPPKPVRHHKWKIPAISRQNITFHDNDNIRIFSRKHEANFYPAPYYRVDMFQPAIGVNGSWIPLMTPNRKEVWYFSSYDEALNKGVKEAQKEMDKWPQPTQLPTLPEINPE